jgi:hypothetical protein
MVRNCAIALEGPCLLYVQTVAYVDHLPAVLTFASWAASDLKRNEHES